MSDYPTTEWTKEVCKIGQGAACCRYLTMSAAGWSCEKLSPHNRAMLDARVLDGKMTARGDNCPGKDSR